MLVGILNPTTFVVELEEIDKKTKIKEIKKYICDKFKLGMLPMLGFTKYEYKELSRGISTSCELVRIDKELYIPKDKYTLSQVYKKIPLEKSYEVIFLDYLKIVII